MDLGISGVTAAGLTNNGIWGMGVRWGKPGT
jgi:hypothetical protein